MKYELRENQGISAPLLALMAVATGLSVANCYYNQPLLGSMAKDFAVSDFSASMVATLTQIGYVAHPCLPGHLRSCRSSSFRWCRIIQLRTTRCATWGLYSPVCS